MKKDIQGESTIFWKNKLKIYLFKKIVNKIKKNIVTFLRMKNSCRLDTIITSKNKDIIS